MGRVETSSVPSAAMVALKALAGAAGGFITSSSSEALSLAFYNKKLEELSPDEKTVIVNLVAALGATGGSVFGSEAYVGGSADVSAEITRS